MKNWLYRSARCPKLTVTSACRVEPSQGAGQLAAAPRTSMARATVQKTPRPVPPLAPPAIQSTPETTCQLSTPAGTRHFGWSRSASVR